MKFAVLSHILPPSPTGQSTVLSRILSAFPPEAYLLLSSRDVGAEDPGHVGPPGLPGEDRPLTPLPPLPFLEKIPSNTVRVCLSAMREIFSRSRRIETILRAERVTALIACTGDLADLPAAYLASRRTGVPLVPWLFDDYFFQWTVPERWIAGWFEPRAIRHAAAVIVPNAAARDAYRARYGVEAAVVANPCELPSLETLDAEEKRFSPGSVNIVYAGSVYHAQFDAFRNLVEAIRRLGRPELRLHIFTSQSAAQLAEGGVSGSAIVLHPHIFPEEVPALLREADLLFLPLAFRSRVPEMIRTSSPGKMGEYLSVGRPVLVHAPAESFVSRYFLENGCGAVVDRDDPSLLAEALRRLLDGGMPDCGIAARTAAERDFSIEGAVAAFRGVLKTVEEPGRHDVR